MKKLDKKNLLIIATYLYGLIIGILISLIVVIIFSGNVSAVPITVNATDSLGNNYTLSFDLPTINQTIILNNYSITNIINSINTTIYLNQTNYTYFNITNVTCFNCTYSYNITNITYINQTNISQYFNGSNFASGNYYVRGEIDDKINSLQDKVNSINTTAIATKWEQRDTWMTIAIGIAILIALLAIILLFSGGAG